MNDIAGVALFLLLFATVALLERRRRLDTSELDAYDDVVEYERDRMYGAPW